MKILAIEKELPNTTEESFQPLLQAEAGKVWEYYQAGVIRELYFHAEQHTAVLILECNSRAEAEEVVNTLPLVQAGLIRFELLPLIPYSGFTRLFSKDVVTQL